jgi:uncharacterized RDD family membrane protein YckC
MTTPEGPAEAPPGAPQAPPPQFAPPPASYWVPPPEKAGAPEGYRFAGFWIRFLAYLIDSVIVVIPFFVLLFAIPGLTGGLSGRGAVDPEAGQGIGLLVLAWLVLLLVYFPIFWARGATPGMMPFKMRIVRTKDGSRLGIGRAILRYIGFILSGWALYIGLIWAAFDDRKQGWHDKLADSFVIRPI